MSYSRPLLFIGLLLLLSGIYAFVNMRTSLFPEVMFPRVSIIADAGQLPIHRMMITVTKPLEGAIRRVRGVTAIKTYTSRGNVTIDVFFEWGLDTYKQKLEVESRINEIQGLLPPQMTISTAAINQSTFGVYGLSLIGPSYNLVELRDAGNLIVRPALADVPGISNAVIWGGRSKEMVLRPDIGKMAALGVSTTNIMNAFASVNIVLGNGMINEHGKQYLTLTDSRFQDVQDLEDVVIRADSIRTIRASDIATVVVQESQAQTRTSANGSEAVLIDIVKQPEMNLVDFTRGIQQRLDEIRAKLPRGMTLITNYDQSAFVDASISSVVKTIYEGLILAIIVMFFFLRSWRASMVVLITIPITIAFTLTILSFLGITINVMSLGAIAASIGLIIDDAIVVIEQIYRTHEESGNESMSTAKHRYATTKKAITFLFPAMLASSLATIVIHFPFRLMSGLAGSFFTELSDTMQISMATSFLVTWLILPVLHITIGGKVASKVARDTTQNGKPPTPKNLTWLTKRFAQPVWGATFVVLIVAGALWAYSSLETGFLPVLDEGTIVLDYFAGPGSSLDETDTECRRIDKIVLAHPDVETYSRRTGVRMSARGVPPNYGDYLIQLHTNRSKSTEDVISDLRTQIAASVPMMKISFGQRIADLLGDMMSTPEPIEIKVMGPSYDSLVHMAKQLGGIMQRVSGVADIDDGLWNSGPTVTCTPNTELISQYGISVQEFQNQLTAYVGGVELSVGNVLQSPSPAQAAMSGGLQIGQYQDREQMRRIMLRFVDYNKNSIDALKQQPILFPGGNTKPLGELCTIQLKQGTFDLYREDMRTAVVVVARLEHRDLGGAINDIKQHVLSEMRLPRGYSIVYGGAYKEQQRSFHELLTILSIATLLVFTVVLFLFRRFRLAFVILFISVLGICGCIIALALIGIPLNVSSYTGMIMVVGILAENAIFTVFQFQAHYRETGELDTSIDFALRQRIRPKLMTAIGAIMALLPLALGIGVGAQMQQPLAIAVIGGFVVGLPLLLLVLPTMLRLTGSALEPTG
ncbi:efflux RND transporter permease subunit [soil metagenome]